MDGNEIVHVDLFSGLGGFAYAIDKIFYDRKIEHIFVENNPFCQSLLRRHWEGSEVHGDIRNFIADSRRKYGYAGADEAEGERRKKSPLSLSLGRNKSSPDSGGAQPRGVPDNEREKISEARRVYILTGGFPCQPFSQAGRRRGTEDDRYLWPEMLESISIFRPQWVVAENVRGLVTWSDGMVLEQVCSDLEKEGYEVRPVIIPAVAVDAPHRRDRIWIIARRRGGFSGNASDSHEPRLQEERTEFKTAGSRGSDSNAPDSEYERLEGGKRAEGKRHSRQCDGIRKNEKQNNNAEDSVGKRGDRRNESVRQVLERRGAEIKNEGPSWACNWLEVAAELCGVDDGLPAELDRGERSAIYKAIKYFGRGEAERQTGLDLSKVDPFRQERLKALGNAIVPQVVMEILKVIKISDGIATK